MLRFPDLQVMPQFPSPSVLVFMFFTALGAQQLLAGAWIKGKAGVAQLLITDAWEQSQQQGAGVQPWSWADTWPVARMWVPRLGIDLIVLNSISGQALAFGPGHLSVSALPGQAGTSVVAGHRDTHFAFMSEIRAGDTVLFELPGRARQELIVTARQVMDSETQPLQPVANSIRATVLLVTCYPLDAVRAGGTLRYVVTLQPADRNQFPGQPASASGVLDW